MIFITYFLAFLSKFINQGTFFDNLRLNLQRKESEEKIMKGKIYSIVLRPPPDVMADGVRGTTEPQD